MRPSGAAFDADPSSAFESGSVIGESGVCDDTGGTSAARIFGIKVTLHTAATALSWQGQGGFPEENISGLMFDPFDKRLRLIKHRARRFEFSDFVFCIMGV